MITCGVSPVAGETDNCGEYGEQTDGSAHVTRWPDLMSISSTPDVIEAGNRIAGPTPGAEPELELDQLKRPKDAECS